jgi:hypothetical protein
MRATQRPTQRGDVVGSRNLFAQTPISRQREVGDLVKLLQRPLGRRPPIDMLRPLARRISRRFMFALRESSRFFVNGDGIVDLGLCW